MALQVFFTISIILLAYFIFACWVRPKRQIKRYSQQIKRLGYKVLQVPYNPFSIDILDAFRKGIREGDAMKDFKDIRSNYDVVLGNALTTPRLQVNHPDFIRSYYAVDKHYQYPKSKRVVGIFSRIAGKGLPFSEGQVWKRKRTILNKVFNFDFVSSQTNRIALICADSIKQLEQQSKKSSNYLVEYNILDLTVRMLSGVMMELFLGGTKQEKINNEPAGQFIKKLMGDITEQAFQPINAVLGPSFSNLGITKSQRRINQNIDIFRKWGINFIKKRIHTIQGQLAKNGKKKQVSSDIIEALIMSKINKTEGQSLEDQMTSQNEIFQQFSAFLSAGTDTTSNFTQMMIYMIACHQNIEARVRQEIDKYMKQDDYSFQNLKNLKYIDNLQKEVTRCFGPGTQLFSRVAKQDNYLNNLKVKKGTRLTIMALSTHYNPQYFKKPSQFRPQRWEEECDNLPNFVFGGFSAGARTCIGKQLALIQSKIAVVKFMKRYKKIILPSKNFKMTFKFLYSPQNFDTKMQIDSQYNL